MYTHYEQPVIKYATPPTETIITYDKGLKKTYHAKTGELIGLEGKITGSVSIGKKRTFTDEQRQAMSERMKNAVSESTSD